ncbi:MAG: hypothetical protein JW714_05350 [Candidatus Omnitrophica bacterium]|nr:hypothetical protein [Candidatus Omnitrophota bacterium]
MKINAEKIDYRQLNELIHQALAAGEKEIILDNVNGQRYIGDGLVSDVKIVVNGVPGNDLGAFMDGPSIVVNSNGQDGVGNTMNAGKIVVQGSCGDILGHSMRGGKIFVRENVGYRVGIHMKAYQESFPIIIAGGEAGDFLGEYMAGGLIIVLGLNSDAEESIVGNYVGTGMHGGAIFIRGKIADYQLGKEVGVFQLDGSDKAKISPYLKEYCRDFNFNFKTIWKDKFVKLIPVSRRPYGKLYAY